MTTSFALAQMNDMPGMSGMNMQSTGILGAYPMTRDSSGTSWQPDDSSHNAIHATAGDWMLMGHLMLTGVYDTQSGPRGAGKTFLEGILMGDRSVGDRPVLR